MVIFRVAILRVCHDYGCPGRPFWDESAPQASVSAPSHHAALAHPALPPTAGAVAALVVPGSQRAGAWDVLASNRVFDSPSHQREPGAQQAATGRVAIMALRSSDTTPLWTHRREQHV